MHNCNVKYFWLQSSKSMKVTDGLAEAMTKRLPMVLQNGDNTVEDKLGWYRAVQKAAAAISPRTAATTANVVYVTQTLTTSLPSVTARPAPAAAPPPSWILGMQCSNCSNELNSLRIRVLWFSRLLLTCKDHNNKGLLGLLYFMDRHDRPRARGSCDWSSNYFVQ